MAVYLFALTSYILMIKRSVLAPRFVSISAILIFLVEAYLMLALTFSVVLLLLLVYSVVAVVVIYNSGIIKKLQQKNLAEKQERDNWKNII
jgi:membrane protein implicated in regulation of membrane protease activity